MTSTAPPCRRGWTHRRAPGGTGATGSPVQTGMDPTPARVSVQTIRLPRADGDGPPRALELLRGEPAPPCRRGWTQVGVSAEHVHVGSPVQTGMDRWKQAGARARRGLPRADGDGPVVQSGRACRVTAPPCRRGWTHRVEVAPTLATGSPVQTGMDPRRQSRAPARAWLPRADGDGPARGSTLRSTGWLPRADGDGPRGHHRRKPADRAPPCRRGWTRPPAERGHLRGGSPVQTGMDRGGRGWSRGLLGLPRADGDGPASCPPSARWAPAPPCRRGWTDGPRPRRLR